MRKTSILNKLNHTLLAYARVCEENKLHNQVIIDHMQLEF